MKNKKEKMNNKKMKNKNKTERNVKIMYFFVLISFIAPVIYLIFRLTFMSDMFDNGRSRADYVLMLIQCILGAIAIHIPTFLSKKLNIKIPVFMYIMFMLFLYCAIFLGEVGSFYYLIPHWDDILHLFSSMMTGFLGYMIVSILNGHENARVNLSPVFIAIFAFCFSVAIGAIWEIYEFSIDGILGLNSQKFRLENGTELIGRSALTDTMKDIIVDCLGALAASLLGCVSIIRKKGFVHDYYHEEIDSDTEKAD